MKKILALLLALTFFLLAFASCVKPSNGSQSDSENNNGTEATEDNGNESTECSHEGGTATCKSLAICSKCNQTYGELDPDNHESIDLWITDESTHEKTYICCSVITEPKDEHSFADGACTVCGYVLDPEEDPEGEFNPPENASIYSGTPETSWYTGDKTEYLLTTADQLAGLNVIRKENEGFVTFKGVTIKLGADMIMNNGTIDEIIANETDNKQWEKVPSSYLFEGTLDGQGHTVSGIYLKLAGAGVQGILGAVGGDATVKDLRVINTYVSGPTASDKSILGTLISKVSGDGANVTVSDVEVHSTIVENGYTVNQVGGIIGAVTDAVTLTLNNCSYNGSITTGGRSVGGMIGAATNTHATVNIANSKNNASLNATTDAGGLIGTAALRSLNVLNSENLGDVTAKSSQGDLYGYQSEAIDPKNGLRPEETTLRTMSFNVSSDFDEFSTAGNDRMTAIKQEIYFYSPDIIGIQEDYSNVLGEFSLSGYKAIKPSNLSSGMSNCSIFYKSGITVKTSGNKFVTSDGTNETVALTAKDVISGNYKLTAEELKEFNITSSTSNEQMRNLTTDKSGTTKILGPKRITWGVFEIDGKDVIYVNVHLHHRAQNADYSTPAVQKLRLMERLKELEMAQAQINTLKNTYPSAEVIIAGDFNDLVGSETYLCLKNKYNYSSAHETALLRYGVSGSWNNAYKSNTQGAVGLTTSASDRSSSSMLDFCFVSSGIKTLKFRIGAGLAAVGAKEKVYTSDHLPIIADLYIGDTVPSSFNSEASVYSGTADILWYTGDKTEYLLTTADQLMGIVKLRNDSKGATTFEGVTIKLGVDMIFNEGSLEDIIARGSGNNKWSAINSGYVFKGIIDGQGHSISGIYMSVTNSYRGMFGGLAGNAVLKNFILENSYFVTNTSENMHSFGCLIARINDDAADVKLENITIADSVKIAEGTYATKYVGGFVGAVEQGKLTVSNCHFNGEINLPQSTYVTAFVGLTSANAELVINNSHGDGSVVGSDYVAGLSGIKSNTKKTNNASCFTGKLTCKGSNKNASFI